MRLVAEDPGAELSGKVSYEEKRGLNESQVDPILSCLGFPHNTSPLEDDYAPVGHSVF